MQPNDIPQILRPRIGETVRQAIRRMQRESAKNSARAAGIPKAFRQYAKRYGSSVEAMLQEIKQAAYSRRVAR